MLIAHSIQPDRGTGTCQVRKSSSTLIGAAITATQSPWVVMRNARADKITRGFRHKFPSELMVEMGYGVGLFRTFGTTGFEHV